MDKDRKNSKHVKMRAETGCSFSIPDITSKPPEARREAEIRFLLIAFRTNPADTVALEL